MGLEREIYASSHQSFWLVGFFLRRWLIFKEEFFMVKEKMTYRDAEVHDGDRRVEEGDLLGRSD